MPTKEIAPAISQHLAQSFPARKVARRMGLFSFRLPQPVVTPLTMSLVNGTELRIANKKPLRRMQFLNEPFCLWPFCLLFLFGGPIASVYQNNFSPN